ncbi:zinc-binding alcohol dehydrogenase family protein [Massilia sp. TS11]|uniref:zinc-binding alcohol dehydrogenase family protein n=1 Tax=Massilia sp. TS11 TaxID=2908003 RepID=UPI001EDB75F3|nr:zinc-binding alcohol dehydrogenase family protein [Massilia sp. TS11]MCG2584823.1 zinc-binding alcohol dehydrogenase family protein [Massilia sp. TS11]
MKAVALIESALRDVDLPEPVPGPRDLLVQVHAVGVNPVDYKVARQPSPQARVLGWDAAGVVKAVGAEVTLFKVGDPVFYAGAIGRAGANSELHVVDERIVGRKPASLDFALAAALPLTSITAWEALFDRLGIDRHGGDRGRRLLVVGGAGGVGSIAIQLGAHVAGLEVIATASRPESAAWVRGLGARQVINHARDMAGQLAALGIDGVDFILCTADIAEHWEALTTMIAPQGRIASITRAERPLDVDLLFGKAASLHMELMFTRPNFQTADMQAQHALLNTVSELIDQGVLRGTAAEVGGPINAANLSAAHAALAGRRTIGKIVLSGF